MKKKKILVADDDSGILDVLQIILEDAGYEVALTSDGSSVKLLKKPLPDLVLLDLWMSGIDGRDICSYLKKQEETKNLPVIIFSANKDTAIIAKECGADSYITKPFEMDEMLTLIEKTLQGK
jgi:DNA-binding response OmpR family regulator